jgi:hypothetical protein
MAQNERSAVLVVRVWRESGAPVDEVRARITMTADGDQPDATEVVAARAEEILDVVRGWLEEFSSG